MAQVAIVITVLNEIENIDGLLSALQSQTLKPREIVIVDGGSVDGTWEKLQQLRPVKSYLCKGNRSQGRNFGVSKTSSPIIAFTDAGCLPHPNWLAELIKPLAKKEWQVVSGYYQGVPKTVFEACLVPYVLVTPDRIPDQFLPSSRSMAMRRGIWNKSGGFNPKVDPSEDFELANRLQKMGIHFFFARDAVVDWRPRKNLQQAAWMFLSFAIGDIHAGILRPKVKLLAIRYYLFCFLVFITPWTWVVVGPYLVWAIAKNYKYVKKWQAMFWLPILQVTADIMVLFGTVVGLLSKQKS